MMIITAFHEEIWHNFKNIMCAQYNESETVCQML